MTVSSVESIVREYVSLPSTSSSKGWFVVKCKLCNDYKKRGGFIFENSSSVGYNCFNCAHETRFSTEKDTTIPDKMQEVFDAFGIETDDIRKLIFNEFVKRGSSKLVLATPEKNPLVYNNIPMPAYFRPLNTTDHGDAWDQLVCDYLLNERQIDPTSYPFLIVDKDECSKKLYATWKGRVVIPYYRDTDLIFYQGRDVTKLAADRYAQPTISRDTVFFGYNEIYAQTDDPLYIHEGFFDALLMKSSIATLTNKMTDQQIAILNKCPRPKVVIPDRRGNGAVLANQAIAEGWSVSFPDIGHDSKDINDAIIKYGRLYVVKSVVENIKSGFAAKAAVAMFCKK